ncbi:MAG TPA: MarR family winged helix-turn-helix transcriptional regulator [Candidatus Acidoferrales bacterium]|nr:MarR family winged helix-turn-helix transcriptional regulator [Candidatus Acidoferrales bacterium]
MIPIDKRPIPSEILRDSAIAHIAQAYFSIAKRLEQKTGCSATRGFILSTLRGGAALNQNQIAKLLGFDRTVVHRSIKGMIREGLLTERKADSGRALLLHLTAKGNKYRDHLIRERRAVDEKLRRVLRPHEISTLIRLLDVAAALEI